jgi:cyclic beta-1,2-glucan synthetase
LRVGEHGLPLFGTGDWNDGMNRVGEKGRGESVWLGWFLQTTLTSFAPVAAARGELDRANRWLAHAAALRSALEQAWDGDWYRRGYFDDGTPLGSASSTECRIDAIAQSWGVISGAADPERAVRAMANVDKQLVLGDAGLVLLFTPPFDHTVARSWLYQGVSARHSGKRRTIHTRRHLDRDCTGDTWERYPGRKLFSLLNPINHAGTRADVQRYKVEPYVVAADVYSVAPHVGRGGWTWYTGSASWMYRAGLEWILGFRVRAGRLSGGAVHSCGLARLRNCLQARVHALPDSGRKPASCKPGRGLHRSRWQEASRGRNSYRVI